MPGQDLPERLRIAGRVRAAIAYAGLRSDDLANALGDEVSLATVRRITSHTQPRGASLAELWTIADSCGVPRTWLERGVWIEDDTAKVEPAIGHIILDESQTVDERFDVVARYLDLIVKRLEAGPLSERDVQLSANNHDDDGF